MTAATPTPGRDTGRAQHGDTVRETALAAAAAGVSVVQIRADGSKAPDGEWKRWQAHRASPAIVASWYSRPREGVGIICGAVSGNLECLEFDCRDTYDAFLGLAREAGLEDVIERLETGYVEDTPGGGVHWLYRCEQIGKNAKLAQREKRPEERKEPKDKLKVLIETRAEGGFLVVAPSHGRVHPSGRPYVLRAGGFSTIPIIEPKAREALFALARSFDEIRAHRKEQTPPAEPRGSGVGDRPGDAFNRSATWEEILEPHGWARVRTRGDGTTEWRRPGKSDGISATTGHTEADTLMVFSTSTLFETVPTSYSKFAAWTLLEHGGDFAAAARALADRGFGSQRGSADTEAEIGDEAAQAEPEGGQTTAGPYSIECGALTWWKATRDGPSAVKLGNFAARIVAEEIRDDGAEQAVQLRIEGTLASGRPLRPASIPAAQFGAMNWTLGAWGAAAIPTAGQGTKDHLRAAIQTLSKEIPQTVIYTCTGWRKIGKRWAYLHAGGAIGADGPVDGIAVDLSGALTGYVLPAPPEGAELVAAVRASLELLDLGVDGVTVPLLAGVARAVIDRADFALHYSGATGVWKSELAALAQSHFGAGFSGRNLPGSWSSTENALEGLAFSAKDALLVVDDFAPRGSTQDIARMHRAAERLIRAAGNASARGRMRADLSLRPPKPPRGLILSTGEDLPPGHSLRARMVIVEVLAGDIDGGRLTRAQEHARRGTFAAALAGFIRWLVPRLEKERERLAEAVLTWRARGGAHRRTPDTLANLAAGIDAYLRFGAEINAIPDAEREALGARVERALLALGEAQAEHLRSEEPTVRFLELLRAAITSGDAHLASARDEGCPCDDGARAWGWDVTWTGSGENEARIARPHGRRIGWVREALGGLDVYLSPGPAYRVAQEYASRQGWAVATGERTLWRRLAEAGLLAASDDGRHTRTVRVGSRTEKVLHLRTGALLSPSIGNIGNIGNREAEDAGERSSRSPEADSVPDPVPDNGPEREQHREQNCPEDAGERSAEALFPLFPLSPILGGEREPVREADPLADVEVF